MIQTLYTLGKVLSKNQDYQKYFEPWEDPFPKKRIADKAKVIVLNLSKKQIQNIEIENFSSKKLDKYLFRSIRGANGTNLVPTFYFQLSGKADSVKWKTEQTNNIRKLEKKILSSIKNNKHEFITGKALEKLPELLLEKSKDLNRDDYYIFTMKIDNEYFGDLKKNKTLFEEEAYTKYYDVSLKNKKICAVTYKEEEEIWGKIDTLGFTINDIAFSRNGFDKKDSYKMFPVSSEAAKILEGSKNIVFKELSRSFYNLKYVIVPHFVKREEENVLEDILEEFLENSTDGSFETTGNSIISNETILNAISKEQKLQNSVYYDILFYQKQQAQFLIKLHVNDVLPSQIKKVFDIKRQIERTYRKMTLIEFEDKKTKANRTIESHINFGILKDFFSKKVKTDYVFHPYFFKIVEAIFQGIQLNEQQIIKSFIRQIQIDFKQRNEDGKSFLYIRRTKESFVLYQYFLHLGLLKNKSIMEENNEQQVQLTADEFISQHPEFFNDKFKEGVFLLGNLSAYLMGRQYKKLKNTPFIKQLNSLNIDEKVIKNILPKLINKLREYDSALPETEQKIAEALVTPHKLSKADISYTFTLGMIMQKEFSKAYSKKKEEEKAANKDQNN